MASWGPALARAAPPRHLSAVSGQRPSKAACARWAESPTPSVLAGLTVRNSRVGSLADAVGGGSAAKRRPPVALRAVSSEPRSGPPLRVLIADDHPLFPELLLSTCRRLDWIWVVGCAANGRDAVTLASATSPDVVLMDIDMPLLDGIEATRRILAFSRPMVIVLTASEDPADHADALAAGARAVLPKTFDPDVLVAHFHIAYLERDSASEPVSDSRRI